MMRSTQENYTLSILFMGRQLLTVCALLTSVHVLAYPSWPATNDDWTPLQTDNGHYDDPYDDFNGAQGNTDVDIVGDSSTYSAGYWYYDGNTLYFRMRVNDDPTGSGSVWDWLLDTDDDTDIDWSFRLNGQANAAELVAATIGGPLLQDVELSNTVAWSGAFGTWARFVVPTGDGSRFGKGKGNNPPSLDAFVDIAIPWAEFSTATGAQENETEIRVGMATSTQPNTLNKDLPRNLTGGNSVADVWSDPITAVPEPSTFLLFTAIVCTLLFQRRRNNPGA